MFDCRGEPHSVMRQDGDTLSCVYCGYQRKLTYYDDWPIRKLANILPAKLVAGIALDRALEAVRHSA